MQDMRIRMPWPLKMKLPSTMKFCLCAVIGWHFVVPILYPAKTLIKKTPILISSTLWEWSAYLMWHLFSWGQLLLPLGGAQFLISVSPSLITICWFIHFLSGFESHFVCGCQSNHLFAAHNPFLSLPLTGQPSSFSLPFNLPCLYSIKT